MKSKMKMIPNTVGTMIREFFDETHVPILYIDMDHYLPRLKLDPAAISKTLFGAHLIAGRLEDLPLKGEYGERESEAYPPALRTRARQLWPGGKDDARRPRVDRPARDGFLHGPR